LEADEAADTFDGLANDGGTPADLSAEAVIFGFAPAKFEIAEKLSPLVPLDCC
jgi:hypothetical protein